MNLILRVVETDIKCPALPDKIEVVPIIYSSKEELNKIFIERLKLAVKNHQSRFVFLWYNFETERYIYTNKTPTGYTPIYTVDEYFQQFSLKPKMVEEITGKTIREW